MNIQSISEEKYPSALQVTERIVTDGSKILEKLSKIFFTGNLKQANNFSLEDLTELIDVVILGTSEVLATNQDSYVDIQKNVHGIAFSYSRYRNQEETTDIHGSAIKYEHIEAALKALDQNGEAFIASGWHDDSTWKRIAIGERIRDGNETISIKESVSINANNDMERCINLTTDSLKNILGDTIKISSSSISLDDEDSIVTIEIKGARYVVTEVMGEVREQIKTAFNVYK